MTGVSGIGQIALYVDRLPEAVAFYRDKVGLKFLFEASGMAFFDVGGVRVMMTQPNQQDPVHRASVLYLRVPDIDAATRALAEQGVKIREQPEKVHSAGGVDLWLSFFEDPSGNLMALMEERRS